MPMKSFLPLVTKVSRWIVYVSGLVLTGYIVFLVFAHYKSQVALQQSTMTQLVYNAEKHAAAATYFYSERYDDLQQLADSRELSIYFENKALGMSPKYGMQASLLQVQALFDAFQKKKYEKYPIYRRIIFTDEYRRTVIASKGGERGGNYRECDELFVKKGPTIALCRRNGDVPEIVISVPYYFKGTYSGQVLAWIHSELIIRLLVDVENDPSASPTALRYKDQFLHLPKKAKNLLDQGRSLPEVMNPREPYQLPLAGADAEEDALAVLIPVENTPFSLVTFEPPASSSSSKSPERLLYSSGGIAILVLGLMFFSMRLNIRNELLEARLEESNKRQQEVDEKNLLLESEISERKRAEDEVHRLNAELEQQMRDRIKKHEELQELFMQVARGKKEWENTLDCVGDVVILTDGDGRIKRCNKALLSLSGKSMEEILDTNWKDALFEDYDMDASACYDMGLELFHKSTGRWFELRHYPFRELGQDVISGMVITVHDSTEMKQVTAALEKAYVDLKVSHEKILQQEKMASIGLLAAGVAHEINNPLGFIKCNLGTLDQYTVTMRDFISYQTGVIESLRDHQAIEEVARTRHEQEIDYIVTDVQELILESLDGVERVRKIVSDLKTFSRMDDGEMIPANINECLATSLNIVWNELKYKASVTKDYGTIPQTYCYPQQLNQVFMNLLVNAGHAIEKQGEISIRTWHGDGSIFVAISDTGRGIPEEQLGRIFEPFFTTKRVGEGTGLGLSITYDIVKKHDGDILVTSEPGKGTTFTVRLPIVEDCGEVGHERINTTLTGKSKQ